ncbi:MULTISPECIES: hypothetical protein [unclassified Leclercia]|uniref:hypothetical protein n=1 Tax=unclassified Leclercia TaxID=2627398 RepID=UPI0025C0C01B|nr:MULTISPECIES: hypothetical protein [unclassified Leclercia]
MSREQFEAWWEINYHNGKPPRFGWAAWRDGDGYKIDDDESELDGMWNAWQAATNALEAKCSALAAENARLKDAISSHAAGFTVCEACGEENISGNDDVCRALNETPATDAFLAEVRAQGAEGFIDFCGEENSVFVESKAYYRSLSDAVAEFAAQLRQEAAQ